MEPVEAIAVIDKGTGGGGAPQASYDKKKKWRHRNCFQTRPLQAFPKKWTSLDLGVRGQLMRSPAGLHRPQKKHSPRSEFMPELHRSISKLTACHLQILHQEIFWSPW